MPTVDRYRGFRITIWHNDHLPRHVHAQKSGAAVRINIDTLQVMSVHGDMSNSDIRIALARVRVRQSFLQEEWDRLHP
jgi:hypothetical protein